MGAGLKEIKTLKKRLKKMKQVIEKFYKSCMRVSMDLPDRSIDLDATEAVEALKNPMAFQAKFYEMDIEEYEMYIEWYLADFPCLSVLKPGCKNRLSAETPHKGIMSKALCESCMKKFRKKFKLS